MGENQRGAQIQNSLIKVILVGSAGVGKTSLISAYFNNSFEVQIAPTIAPAYNSKTFTKSDGSVVTLQIWDTAGQERYHSVSQIFYRDSNVALVCFEAGDEVSTNDVQKWIDRVKEQSVSCIIDLVITKSDLKTPEELQAIEENAQILRKCVNAKSIYITSSLTRRGINQLFEDMAETSFQAPLPVVTNQIDKPVTESDPQEKCC